MAINSRCICTAATGGVAVGKWCAQTAGEAVLPSGERVHIDRGAGQRVPDGPVKAAVTIGHKVGEARADVGAAGGGTSVDA